MFRFIVKKKGQFEVGNKAKVTLIGCGDSKVRLHISARKGVPIKRINYPRRPSQGKQTQDKKT